MDACGRIIKPTRVFRYDGQGIWTTEGLMPDYELGSFLGTGSAGVVYEATCTQNKRNYAIKVLNPTGYKLCPSASLRQCEVAARGISYVDGESSLSEQNVWWLLQRNTQHFLAAYHDIKSGQMKELTLLQCVSIWGLDLLTTESLNLRKGKPKDQDSVAETKERQKRWQQQLVVNGESVSVPVVPPKYAAFLIARARIFREISSMRTLSSHRNVLALKDALEFVQDSKATVFLVLELARGGELFDRIKVLTHNVDCGAEEQTARGYFRQLLSGVKHCHDRGVCHRDLKPENLLLADATEHSTLKIADFGFSALILPEEDNGGPHCDANLTRKGGRNLKRLQSKVGTPYYVAPEVQGYGFTTDQGYDGAKADAWSIGVILYAMLAGTLPFEKELRTCKRFHKFSTWARVPVNADSLRAHCLFNHFVSPKDPLLLLDYPHWFFLRHLSLGAKSLLSGLLHPDPQVRLSIKQALSHPWVRADTNLQTLNVGNGGVSEGVSEGSSESSISFSGEEEGYVSRTDSSFLSEDFYGDSEEDELPGSIYSGGSSVEEAEITVKASTMQMDQLRKSLPKISQQTPLNTPKNPVSSPPDPAREISKETKVPAKPPPSENSTSKNENVRSQSFRTPPQIKTQNESNNSKYLTDAKRNGCDEVDRSSRFTTNAPAKEVLQKIAAIVNEDNQLLPYMNQKVKQEAIIHWNDFKVEVVRGGILVCAVQIYIMRRASAPDRPYGNDPILDSDDSARAGMYMVEFLREQLDIYLFKRLYEGIKMQLQISMSKTMNGSSTSRNIIDLPFHSSRA